jgi:hypothetical protein
MLSYGAIPCYSPCWFPFAIFLCQFLLFLRSLLLGIPPLVWCDPVHPGPRLLVNCPPLPIPSPFQFPDPPGASPNQLCVLLRRHHPALHSPEHWYLLLPEKCSYGVQLVHFHCATVPATNKISTIAIQGSKYFRSSLKDPI